MYSHSLKSKDIDIILDYPELAKLRESHDVFKNDRLKKYEIKEGDFDVDIYLPYYSELGIDVKIIEENLTAREGFVVPSLEVLLLLKLRAWQSRQGSVKGKKDELDILSLIILPEFNWEKYLSLVEELDLGAYNDSLISLIEKTRRIGELGVNEQKMAKIRKDIFDKMRFYGNQAGGQSEN